MCKGGVLYYEYEIHIGGNCKQCGIKGHLNCLPKHECKPQELNEDENKKTASTLMNLLQNMDELI